MELEEREREILKVLKEMPHNGVILIGGYAINAYTPPRFSIDCDILIENDKEVKKVLLRHGFKQTEEGKLQTGYGGGFLRFQKGMLSFDILIGGVLDRQTGIYFGYDFLSTNSKERVTVGRAIAEKIKIRIPNPEVLFIMKFVSCRKQDIRDIFMLSNLKLDIGFIADNIKRRYGKSVKNAKTIEDSINSIDFKNALQGVYGKIPEGLFDKTKRSLFSLLKEL